MLLQTMSRVSVSLSDHAICICMSFQPIPRILLHAIADHAVPVPTGHVSLQAFLRTRKQMQKLGVRNCQKDPKQEYDNFLKSIADDVQEVEARQEVEAVEAAQDKADQEAFEHGCALGLCVCCTSQFCVLHTTFALLLCLMMCWHWVGSSTCKLETSFVVR